MHKPLISKIRCLSPNSRAAATRNFNHLYYIATREGVDLAPLAQELDRHNGDMAQAAENGLYAKYMSERPRSSGLFGNIDTHDVNAVCLHMRDISKNKNVYRGIVSLCQEDAEELNFTGKEGWASFLKQNMPDVAEILGIGDKDLAWVAAFHNEAGHPHVHYMLWSEADEQHSKAFISVPQQHQCREILSKRMFQQEHELYGHLKSNFETLLKNATKENIRLEISGLKQEVLGTPNYRTVSRINKQLFDDANKALLKLIEALPRKGRLAYGLMPKDIKKEIRSVVDLFLGKYELQDEYQKYIEAYRNLAETHSPTKEERRIAAENAIESIYTDLGNIILKAAKELRQNKDLLAAVNGLNETFEHQGDSEPLEAFPGLEPDPDAHDPEPVPAMPSMPAELALPQIPSLDLDLSKDVHVSWSKEYKSAMSELYLEKPDFNKVIQLLRKEHQKGNILATYELGKIHERDLDGTNPKLADAYYQEAFTGFQTICHQNQNPAYAAYRLGKMYEYGQGTEQDIQAAKTCYEAAKDNAYAQYSLAKILMAEAKTKDDSSNNEHIVQLLKNSSTKHSHAAYELGRIYQHGVFAAQNESVAQNYYKLAFTKFTEMAGKSQKNDDSLYRLGKMYESGLGTEKNIEKAKELYEKAAALKNTNALYSLAKIYMQSDDEQLCQKAIGILEKLFQDNPDSPTISYALGSAYSDTQPTYDIHKAIQLLKISANLQNDFAMLKLGNIYSASIDKYPELQADIPLAISYFQSAADLGNHHALYSLGKIFSDPESGHYDIHQAIECLKKSADSGNDFSMLKLGNIYLWGKGVPKDEEEGMYWIEKSMAAGNEYAAQAKQAYETYIKVCAAQSTFSLFSNILNALCYSNNVSRGASLYTDSIKGNKKAIQENARKNPHKHTNVHVPET